MPKFFFHFEESGARTIDDEGIHLENLDAARDLAIKCARSIMAHEVVAGKLCLNCHIDIVSSEGERKAQVPFSEAIVLSGLPKSV